MLAPVEYISNFVENPDNSFNLLKDELAWIRLEQVPRSEYYYNDIQKPYIYGKGKGMRKYLPMPGHSEIFKIREKLEKHTGFKFEVCFLNRYLNQRDQLGWHSDDSPEMNDDVPIVTISLGVEREIWFRSKDGSSEIEKVKLEHGSCCIMAAGMQDTWQHRIPKASFQCGERISLTYRGYKNETTM
jgi:alkylated DNA repair dioxygenase AlkB